MPSMVAENLAMAGAAMGLALLSSDKGRKAQILSSSITAMLGISEPAMYGFVIPSGYGFIGAMLGGLVGGLFAGLFKFKMYMIASSSIIGIPAMFGKNSGYGNVIVGCIEMVISFAAAMAFTVILQKSNFSLNSLLKRGKNSDKIIDESQRKKIKATTIVSPIDGQLISLNNVKDEVFSSGVMGPGVAIQPSEGLVKSPVNGVVMVAYKTGHAIGLKSKEGAEVLIHVGIDTVNLKGKGFNVLVKKGQEVNIGDPLVDVNWQFVKSQGYEVVTPIIITNAKEYREIKIIAKGKVKTGQEIFELN